MARQPFFSGNYGSALAQIDTRPIMQGAAAQAAMYQGLGQNIGGAIEKYGLNKEKRNKLSAQLEGRLQGPRGAALIQSLTSSGNEEFDKGNQTLIEKVLSGDAKIAELERLSGITSTLVEEDAAVAKQNAAQMDALLKKSMVTNSLLDAQGKELEINFNKANETNRRQQENMKTFALERADTMGQLELALLTEKNPLVIKELKQKLEAGRLENEKLERNNLFDKDTYDKRVSTIINKEKQAEADMWASVRGLEASDPDAADRKDAAQQIADAKKKGVNLTFVKNPKGKGLILSSVKGDIENLGQSLPGFPDHLLYGGSLFDLSGPIPIKVGIQDISADTTLRIDVLDALTDEAAATYLKHKQLGVEEEGYYIIKDVDGELSQVKVSTDMDKITNRIMELRKGIGGADPLGLR